MEKHEGKKYLMVDDYVLNKLLDQIKEIISTEQFDNTKIIIDIDNELPDEIIFKKS